MKRGWYPPLIFLGIGAMTDFGAMLSNPRLVLLGVAAQAGIFLTFIGAIALGFGLEEAAAIGIIGGADGPTAIFLSSMLAPERLGAIAIAAYSYMALVPVIQPPIIRLLTTKEERRIRMEPSKPVSKRVRMAFPVVGLLLTTFIAPGAIPLLGMLFFGNLLKESGVLFAKVLDKVSKDPINPIIGAAGVSAVPDSARVCLVVGAEEDPQNFLLMHAMAPNVAGVIGSAVAAGVLLAVLG